MPTDTAVCTCANRALILRAADLRCLACGKPVPVIRVAAPAPEPPGIALTAFLLGAVTVLGVALGWVLALVGR